MDSYCDALSCSGHDDRNGALVLMGNGCQEGFTSQSDAMNSSINSSIEYYIVV